MKTRIMLAALAALAMAVVATSTAAAQPAKDSGGPITQDCGEGNTVTFSGPTYLWPPNHKYRAISFTADDNDTDVLDGVMLATEGTHEEFVDGEELNGTGNTGDDVSPMAATGSGDGTATTNHSVRGERAGGGDGRTYTFTYEATFDNPAPADTTVTPCVGSFTIAVPHDQGNGGGKPASRKAKRLKLRRAR
jgi:hypothetical protein